MIALKNILVGTDFGEAADTALTYGRALARTFGATLHLLHVTEDIYMNALGGELYASAHADLQQELDVAARAELNKRIVDSDNSGPPTIPAVVSSGRPALAIIQYAKSHEVDLIVMGTHGRGPLAHLVMGSVAERVVRLAPCPVLTVRHPEHDFVMPDALAVPARLPA
jgi:nucleotide-binding universal stress UspA family protein